ncbi:hypothetical protein P4B35_23575, partial [Pontiellaceae bacterium B12227]|nr:hypothetical protein [Pontiellaceae bacterium B12227]
LTEYDATNTAGAGGVSLNAGGGYASFTGVGYLEINRNSSLKTGTFTVSYWWRSSNLLGQGNFQGPSFSTEAGSTQDFQFTTIGSGVSGNLEVRDTAQLIISDTELYPDGIWYNTIIQSAGGGTFDIWISPEGGSLTQVGDDVAASNGGLVLEDFIFGANRAKNTFGTLDLANVKIYDDATVGAASLFAEGPMLVPPPPPPDPIAVYDFGDGDLLDDSTGNGNALTGPFGSTASVTTNADGFSAYFDGLNGSSYLMADLSADNSRLDAFTVSFWWKTDALDQNTSASLMSCVDNQGLNDWQLNDAGSDIALTGDNGAITQAQAGLAEYTWYHTALVSTGNMVSLYMTPLGSANVELVGTLTNAAFNLQDLRIGANRAGNLTYDSDIGLVKVYDAALGGDVLDALLQEVDSLPIIFDFTIQTSGLILGYDGGVPVSLKNAMGTELLTGPSDGFYLLEPGNTKRYFSEVTHVGGLEYTFSIPGSVEQLGVLFGGTNDYLTVRFTSLSGFALAGETLCFELDSPVLAALPLDYMVEDSKTEAGVKLERRSLWETSSANPLGAFAVYEVVDGD